MDKNEDGYIVVETIGSFVPLVLLVVSILSLVNIVSLQARVHCAMTQAAQTVSMYSYALEVTGIAGKIQKIAGDAEKTQAETDELIDNVNLVLKEMQNLDNADLGKMRDGVKGVGNQVKDLAKNVKQNPKEVIANIIKYFLNEGTNLAFGELVLEPLVEHYLENGELSGKEYLESAHVIGELDFYDFSPVSIQHDEDGDLLLAGHKASSKFLSNGEITIIVRYDVDYTFGALPLPEKVRPKLSIMQEVKTRAWLGGSK